MFFEEMLPPNNCPLQHLNHASLKSLHSMRRELTQKSAVFFFFLASFSTRLAFRFLLRFVVRSGFLAIRVRRQLLSIWERVFKAEKQCRGDEFYCPSPTAAIPIPFSPPPT